MEKHNVNTSLYNLFGTASAADAAAALRARCLLRVPLAHTAASISKHDDLAHMRTLYSDQLIQHLSGHQTYRYGSHAIATLPLAAAESIRHMHAYHAHSFQPSAMNTTLKHLIHGRYDILIPITPAADFQHIVTCINTHFGLVHDPLHIVHHAGKNYVAATRERFESLTRAWYSTPESERLIAALAASEAPQDNYRFTNGQRVPRAGDTTAAVLPFKQRDEPAPEPQIHERQSMGEVVRPVFGHRRGG